MKSLDPDTEFGARALARLEREHIGWFTTVSADGTPQPSPIWFLWDGASVLIYSQPNAPKMRNIAAHPRASLHLETAAEGEEFLVLEGTARLDPDAPASNQNPAYVEKYDAALQTINMSWEGVSQDFSAKIRFYPERVRGS